MSLMDVFRRITLHAPLMEQMTRKLGVHDKLFALPASTGVARRAAERCLECEHAGECTKWLAETRSAELAPDYCNNKDLFVRLGEQPSKVYQGA